MFPSRSLACLLCAYGAFSPDRHRALADAEAGVWLLTQQLPGEDRTVFAALRETAAQPTVRIWATGAPFDAKDELKSRGYRWMPRETNGIPRSWWTDVPPTDLEAEFAWLPDSTPCGPSVEPGWPLVDPAPSEMFDGALQRSCSLGACEVEDRGEGCGQPCPVVGVDCLPVLSEASQQVGELVVFDRERAGAKCTAGCFVAIGDGRIVSWQPEGEDDADGAADFVGARHARVVPEQEVANRVPWQSRFGGGAGDGPVGEGSGNGGLEVCNGLVHWENMSRGAVRRQRAWVFEAGEQWGRVALSSDTCDFMSYESYEQESTTVPGLSRHGLADGIYGDRGRTATQCSRAPQPRAVVVRREHHPQRARGVRTGDPPLQPGDHAASRDGLVPEAVCGCRGRTAARLGHAG